MHNKASQNRTFGAGLANARLCLRRYAHGVVLKAIILTICGLALIACSALPKKDVIPRSWVVEEITLKEYFDSDYSFCENLSKRVKIKCARSSGNPFTYKLSEGYKVYRYSTPKERWESFSGHKGIVLEIGGIIVDTKTTTVQ